MTKDITSKLKEDNKKPKRSMTAAEHFKNNLVAEKEAKHLRKYGGFVDMGGDYINGHKSVYIPPQQKK